MKTCTYPVVVHGDGSAQMCQNICEGRTEFCSTHNRQLRKESENTKREAEKRANLIAKAALKNQVPRKTPNKVSPKREEENKAYSELRGIFLMNHPYCEIKANEFCAQSATTVHHSAGRVGVLFLDVTKWKGACMNCHSYCEQHPKEAKERGWSSSRLEKEKPLI